MCLGDILLLINTENVFQIGDKVFEVRVKNVC